MLDNVGTGSVRKRGVRRSAAQRAAIVAESYEPGNTVSGVARQHGILPSQLSGWRSAARAKVREADKDVQFAEMAVSPSPFVSAPIPQDNVEIAVGSVVVRLPKNTAAARIADIAQRLVSQG